MKSAIKASLCEQVLPERVCTEARRQQPQETLCSLADGTEAREPCSGPGGGQSQAPTRDTSTHSAHLPPGHGHGPCRQPSANGPRKVIFDRLWDKFGHPCLLSLSCTCVFLEVVNSPRCWEFGGRDFPGGAVVKHPPANTGGMGSIPALGNIPHASGNYVHASQLLSLCSRARELQQGTLWPWEARAPQLVAGCHN